MTADVVLASELEPGRIICLKTRSIFGAIIRACTGSPYDHTAVITGPGEITQATLRGVKRGPLSQFRNCQAVANSAEEMTRGQRTAVVNYVLLRVGEEYAFPLIVVIGLRRLGLRWPWLVRICNDRDAVFCSELAVQAGLTAVPPMPWLCDEPFAATVRPDELADRACMRPVVWDG